MKTLGPTSRHLVAAARRGLDPSPDVAARVRAKVALAVGAGVAASPVVEAAAPHTAAIAPHAAAIGAAKVAAVVALAGALIAGTWFVAARHGPGTPAPAITMPATTREAAPTLVVRSSIEAPPRPSVIGEPSVESQALSQARADHVAAPPAHPRTTPRATASVIASEPEPEIDLDAAPASLAREVELVDRATAALHGGDAAHALAILGIYQRETSGHGQLAEDAAALEIEARCHTHEPIRRLFEAFDQHWPHSVQRARLTMACKGAS